MSKKPTSKEQEQILVDLALMVDSWLKKEGCYRIADNQDPPTRSKDEICERLDISPLMFRAVRVKAWELGIPLVYHHYREYNFGYYIGKKGEEARMLAHAQAVLAGIGESLTNGIMALGKVSNRLEDAEEYSRLNLNRPLTQLPNMCKALGSPLPRVAVKVLTSGEEC